MVPTSAAPAWLFVMQLVFILFSYLLLFSCLSCRADSVPLVSAFFPWSTAAGMPIFGAALSRVYEQM
jgi:hypothetical protein